MTAGQAAQKILDSLKNVLYSFHMTCANTLIFKSICKAAWHRIAVAEGGFY